MRLLTLIAGLLLNLSPVWAIDHLPYSIYLVRHAEKMTTETDPALTFCGRERADKLAVMLEETKLKAVYSTSFLRTMSTANPTARKHRLPVKFYDADSLDFLALTLKRDRENTLVVGHSNTTPQLVSLLTGQDIAPITEKDYQFIYQVQFIDRQPYLTVWKHPHECKL